MAKKDEMTLGDWLQKLIKAELRLKREDSQDEATQEAHDHAVLAYREVYLGIKSLTPEALNTLGDFSQLLNEEDK